MSDPVLGVDGVYYGGSRPLTPVTGRGRFTRVVTRLRDLVFAPFRRGVEQRAITSVPWDQGGPGLSTASVEQALSLIPLFACVRILADAAASLPVQSYRKLGEERIPMSNLPSLLASPASRGTWFRWVQQCIWSLALRGNAYGLITARDGMAFPTTIEWLYPDEVHVDETHPTNPVYYWNGFRIPDGDMFHVAWFPPPGRVVSLSPVGVFAATIGVGMSATSYGRSWFDSDGTPPAVMKNTQKIINPDEAKIIRDRLMAAIRSRKPLVHGVDWEFSALKVNPEESQFIQTMSMNATQIAAIYGVPAEMVGGEAGGSLTYSTVEMNTTNFATFTMRPWLVRLEQAITQILPERQYMRFNVDAMIRTDLLSRYTAHSLALKDGWRSIDEIRALEDLPPLPNGEGATYGPQPITEPTPAPPPGPDPADDARRRLTALDGGRPRMTGGAS